MWKLISIQFCVLRKHRVVEHSPKQDAHGAMWPGVPCPKHWFIRDVGPVGTRWMSTSEVVASLVALFKTTKRILRGN